MNFRIFLNSRIDQIIFTYSEQLSLNIEQGENVE